MLATVVVLAAVPDLAVAGWSGPRSFAVGGQFASATAVAVDSHGDSAAAWTTVRNKTPRRPYLATVHVAVRTARGHLIKRTLWSSHDAQAPRVSVVLTSSEVTVSWGYYNLAGTRATVRAAYGPLAGRWALSRAIGRITEPGAYPPTPWYPHLAIAPSGEVVLAWNAWNGKSSSMRGVAVAWRAPGRRFGKAETLRSAPLGAVPQFDSHGNVYVSGYCNAEVLTAPERSHRFGPRVVVASGPVLAFNLSLAGASRGLASWATGVCSFDAAAGNTPGPVHASVLRAGKFGAELALSPAAAQGYYTHAVALPTGGLVTWATFGTLATYEVPIGADGLAGATQQITGGSNPLAADGGGDLVLGPPPNIGLPGIATAVAVRPAGGGADQPAPARSGQVAVAAPVGRGAALLWSTSPTGSGPTLALSVWRP
jgi:hypothetical protein